MSKYIWIGIALLGMFYSFAFGMVTGINQENKRISRVITASYALSLDTLIELPAGYYKDFPNGAKNIGARCFPLDTGSALDELVTYDNRKKTN